MRLIGMAVLTLMLTWAEASEQLPATRVDSSPAFDSADTAAVSILFKLSAPFSPYEEGGAIVEQDGRFFYSEPVTVNSGNSLGFKVQLRKGQKIVGFYHTHPELPLEGKVPADASPLFSVADVKLGIESQRLMYMASEASMEIRKLVPNTPGARRALSNRRPFRGDLMLNLKDTPAMLALAAGEPSLASSVVERPQ